MNTTTAQPISIAILLILLTPLIAYAGKIAKDPVDARVKLGQMNVPYTSDEFIESAERGDRIAVELFLIAGMKPDAKAEKFYGNDVTALMVATKNAHVEIVKLLLDNGADPNVKTKQGSLTAPYMLAFFAKLDAAKKKDAEKERKYREIIDLLSKAGFSPASLYPDPKEDPEVINEAGAKK